MTNLVQTKTIYSFIVLFAIATVMVSSTPTAFADHSEVTIIPDTGSGSATDDCVDVEYGCYVPGTAVVDLGGKVIFSNTDSAAHTFSSGNPRDGPSDVFESGFLASGKSAEYIADTLGEFDYFCMVHPWMQGMLIVQEAVHEEEVVEEVHEEEVVEEVHVEEVVEEGGGCLIATATFGSELAPQVQQLRELRDNTILQTESGVSFMTGFNQFYYSFSPVVADLERESPIFKEAVKLTLTPMLSSLSLLNYVDIDSEQEMLSYGISLIILNAGMYFVAPALIIYKIRK